MRQVVLFALVMLALAAMLIGLPAQMLPVAELPTLSYVTTAHQFGVVGYRDPFGAISPDGTRLAYAEGRFIRVVPIGGGVAVTLAPGEGQIRHLYWTNNSMIAAEDVTPSGRWWLYQIGKEGRQLLWDLKSGNDLRQLTCDVNGPGCAGLTFTSNGAQLFRVSGDSESLMRIEGRASWPAFRPNGEVACIVNARLTLPCGAAPLKLDVDRDVYGPIAFSRDGNTVYFSSPNAAGMVELWSADVTTRRARRLSNFSRDAYAPSVSSDGTVVFKVQSYRTHLADIAVAGGVTRQLTTFQSETPSFHPMRPLVAFTYGTWRRVIDDAKYPDIAQEIGFIDVSQQPLPAAKPSGVLEDSDSEDQAMTWSPNGKWIAFHSHREMSDDIWLRPENGGAPDKRITFLGRGAEVGWPRWSPDGKTVLLDGARKGDGRSVIYAIGVDQDNGALTSELREVKAEAFEGDITHAEWLPNNTGVIAIAKEGPGRHAIMTLPIAGGRPSFVHRFATEHDFPGLGIAPDGRQVAFTAPAADGYFQIFRMPIAGGDPVQVTSDRSHKSQPAWSPDGARIAFTVWSYEAVFWSMK